MHILLGDVDEYAAETALVIERFKLLLGLVDVGDGLAFTEMAIHRALDVFTRQHGVAFDLELPDVEALYRLGVVVGECGVSG